MKTKFDLRKIAFELVPFKSQEDAINKIKQKVAELKLNDKECLEMVKQVNTASHYTAYKTANFMMSGDDMGVITVKPSQVFKELLKVSSLGKPQKKLSRFTLLKEKIGPRKLAKLEENFELHSDPVGDILDIIKFSKLDTTEAIDARIALKDIKKTAELETYKAKNEFIELANKFENCIKMFPNLRTKYASLIDVSKLDFIGNRIPTARDIIEIRGIQEKLSALTDRLGELNNVIDLIEGE